MRAKHQWNDGGEGKAPACFDPPVEMRQGNELNIQLAPGFEQPLNGLIEMRCFLRQNRIGKTKEAAAYLLLFQKGGSAREKEWEGIDSPLFFYKRGRKSAGIDLTISAVFYREKFSESRGFLTL